jgi:hypothetical protein
MVTSIRQVANFGQPNSEERVMSIKVKLDRENREISWVSDVLGENGEQLHEPVTARLDEMSEELKERAMYHGLSARGTDAGAIAFGHLDGKDKPKRYATDSEKLARIARVVSHLNNPSIGWDWDLRPSSDPLANKSAEELERLISAAKAKLAGLGVG